VQLRASLAAGEWSIWLKAVSHPSKIFGLGRAGPCTSNGAASGGRTMILNRSPLSSRFTVSDTRGSTLAAGFGAGTAGIAIATAKHRTADAAPRAPVTYAECGRIDDLSQPMSAPDPNTSTCSRKVCSTAPDTGRLRAAACSFARAKETRGRSRNHDPGTMILEPWGWPHFASGQERSGIPNAWPADRARSCLTLSTAPHCFRYFN
jgi:hypothetical protein